MSRTTTTGVVVEFDDDRGLGTVTTDDGATYPFHCTAIADGTRTIPAGTRVTFAVVAGPLGRTEAAEVQTALVDSAPASPDTPHHASASSQSA